MSWDSSPQSNHWAEQVTIARPDWMTDDIEAKLKAGNYPLDKDGLLMMHKEAQEKLAYWKAEEMDLRKIVASVLVPAKTEGTVNVPLGGDWNAKVVHKYNYNLNPDNKLVWAALDKIAKLGNEGPFIAERLVSWTPNFLKTEYTTVKEEAEGGNQNAKAILAVIEGEMLTITEAAPTVEVAEKKGKRK